MGFNPKNLLKAKERYRIFKEQHPKMISFGRTLNRHAVKPGTVIEIKATTPEGESYTANLKVTPEDVESLPMFIK